MRHRACCLAALVVICAVSVTANKKNKSVLPDVVLKAQTVCVLIQPNARELMSDPNANLKTQQEVEKALMKWGRLRLVSDVQTADLVIAVQKGTGKAADATVGGGPVDDRPVIVEGTDGAIRVGGHQGTPPPSTQYPGAETGRPSEGTQIGGSDDRLAVYLGAAEYPLDRAPIWNYSGKDALKAPDVKAVEEFRKAIAEAEKAAQQRQQQKQTSKGTRQPGSGNGKP